MLDFENDCDIVKRMYSKTSALILKEIEEECDKLEYDGSFIFDVYPDQFRLEMMAAGIYDRVRHLSNGDYSIRAESMEGRIDFPDCPDRSGRCRRPHHHPDYRPDGKPDWLKQLVDSLLYNEVVHRRERCRRHKENCGRRKR